LKKYFKENNLNFDLMFQSIKDIVIKSILSISDESIKFIKRLTKHNNCLFELYGFDILIDSEFKPWLMEINLNPSLNVDTKLDYKIKSMLISDILTLVGIIPYKHKKEELFFFNNFDTYVDNNKRMKINNSNKNYLNFLDDIKDEGIEVDEETPSTLHNKESKLSNEIIVNESDDIIDEPNPNPNGDKMLEIDCSPNLKKDNSIDNEIYDMDSFDFYKFIETEECKEVIYFAEDELNRKGNFINLFPLSSNVNYYSKFLNSPGNENLILWKWLLNNKPYHLLKTNLNNDNI